MMTKRQHGVWRPGRLSMSILPLAVSSAMVEKQSAISFPGSIFNLQKSISAFAVMAFGRRAALIQVVLSAFLFKGLTLNLSFLPQIILLASFLNNIKLKMPLLDQILIIGSILEVTIIMEVAVVSATAAVAAATTSQNVIGSKCTRLVFTTRPHTVRTTQCNCWVSLFMHGRCQDGLFRSTRHWVNNLCSMSLSVTGASTRRS
mmetsp:Transcript_21979/g.51980  ORF Transcript_21979/g.51980 Transcript_21979/m.51980 type:complete len:203 (+) Transcript_21979:2853-3461(+)